MKGEVETFIDKNIEDSIRVNRFFVKKINQNIPNKLIL